MGFCGKGKNWTLSGPESPIYARGRSYGWDKLEIYWKTEMSEPVKTFHVPNIPLDHRKSPFILHDLT